MYPEEVVAWSVSPSPERCSFCGAQKTEERRLIATHDGAAAICEDCIVRFVDLFGRWEERSPRTPEHASELSRRYGDRVRPLRLDPRDLGPPITVQLGSELIGDLGNARVDARVLLAIALREGRIAGWLKEHGIDEKALRDAFGAMDLGFEPPETE